ncbi:preprotein translocase subunit YajC, partial [Streptococcus ruminantium]
KVGDEIILLSGLHGKIIKLTGSLVELQIAENVHVYVEKELLSLVLYLMVYQE